MPACSPQIPHEVARNQTRAPAMARTVYMDVYLLYVYVYIHIYMYRYGQFLLQRRTNDFYDGDRRK